jgi:hypothetical protein
MTYSLNPMMPCLCWRAGEHVVAADGPPVALAILRQPRHKQPVLLLQHGRILQGGAQPFLEFRHVCAGPHAHLLLQAAAAAGVS